MCISHLSVSYWHTARFAVFITLHLMAVLLFLCSIDTGTFQPLVTQKPFLYILSPIFRHPLWLDVFPCPQASRRANGSVTKMHQVALGLSASTSHPAMASSQAVVLPDLQHWAQPAVP